jgi:hypothetical protein
MEGIVPAEVYVNFNPRSDCASVVLTSRNAGIHEERSLIHSQFEHLPDILCYRFGGVMGEANNVPSVDRDAVVVAISPKPPVLLYVVLWLACIDEVPGVHGFNTHEDLGAACLGKHRKEIPDFVAGQVSLDHEIDLAAFVAEFYETLKDLPPARTTREIVIGEKEEGLPLALADCLNLRDNGRGTTIAGFATLHVNYRAEAASERTTTSRVERSNRSGETLFEVTFRILR